LNLFFFDQNSKRNIYYNLALEESISLNLVQSGYAGGLRFWKNEDSIVLGLSEKIKDCVKEKTIDSFSSNFERIDPKKHNKNLEPYIARRSSGGGTVYHDLNSNINYSVFISLEKKSELYPIQHSYEIILSLVANTFKQQEIEVFWEGKSDLAILSDGIKKKISGNAQFRKKNCLVHHGTILFNTDIIEKINRFLPHPKEEPGYREKRHHDKFISSLPETFSIEKFKTDFFLLFTEFMGNKIKDYDDRNSFKLEKKFRDPVFKDSKRLFKEKYFVKDFIFGEAT